MLSEEKQQDTAPSGASSMDSLIRIERSQQRLWLLALVLFLLLSISLLIIDAAFSAAERLISGVAHSARLLVEHLSVAAAFLIVVVLVCVYFREKLVMIRNQNRELVRALEANARMLALRNSQLDTWEHLSHQLTTDVNLPQLLDLIVKTAAQVTESDCAAAIIAEPTSPHLRLAAIHRRGMQTELARRVAAGVISTGTPVHLTPDRLPAELDRPDLSWEGVAALAASPLVVSEAVSGCLLVGRLAPAEPYPASVMQVLGSFASQASIALEKAHLQAENQRQLQSLSRLLDELRSAQSQLAESRQRSPLGRDGSAEPGASEAAAVV